MSESKEFQIGAFHLGEYATLAEQIAKQKQVEKDTKARMEAEALRIKDMLADALFNPYVGKKIRGNYDHGTFTLFRWKHYVGNTLHLFAFDPTRKGFGDQPGTPPDTHSVKGWVVSVTWDAQQQRMRVSLEQQEDRSKPMDCGDGDVGTQAVRAARALAEMIGTRLVLEREAKS